MNFAFETKDPKATAKYMKSYVEAKSPDCSFYSQDGNEISVHKELFCQTEIMQGLVKSLDCCCTKIEVIFSSVTIQELDLMVEFLYNGQFSCNCKYLAARVISNLQEFLGFSKNLSISYVEPESQKDQNLSKNPTPHCVPHDSENLDELSFNNLEITNSFLSVIPLQKIQSEEILENFCNFVENNTLANHTIAGASLERVRRVHPHPLKLGNGCAAPVLKT